MTVIICSRGVRKVERPRMGPLGDLRLKHPTHEAPPVNLRPTAVTAPCDVCRARAAAGEPPLPFHPCCAARLLAASAGA